ncbi:MAG: von Willebrand factor type A domain-containing protein [Acidobacteriota bacterium]|nr:MAG: von Willebrand factor type A domain-containing protein [Acidobacteriota bacterium]
MKRQSIRTASACLVLAALIGSGLWMMNASTDTVRGAAFERGTLEGTVTTPDGTPLPGACCLYLKHPGFVERIGPQTTRQDGLYRFTNLEPGRYTLEVEIPKFSPLKADVRVLSGESTKHDVMLQPEKSAEAAAAPRRKPVEESRKAATRASPEMEKKLSVRSYELQSTGQPIPASPHIKKLRIAVPDPTPGQHYSGVQTLNSLGYVGGLTVGTTGCRYPPAHGGTRPPNNAAFDAMFFETYGVNPFIDTEDDRLSTFATDVDTASYTVTRRYLTEGVLPPKEAVRVEEFVNFFDYGYEPPSGKTFAVYAEGAPSRFGGPRHKLLRIGVQGKKIIPENRKDAVLTFVIDVSGSMDRENRLELVKKALRLLLDELTERDRVGIVVYGSDARVVLEHTGLQERGKILTAIEWLAPQGATNAEAGLRLGYELAAKAFRENTVNRVILCSDGVANVGQTGAEQILEKIKAYAEKGITLTSVGFGMGNYNDVLLEKLGDKGDGHYAYVDTLGEAKRIFVENLTGTLQVIARDVKIQVDFNPQRVRSYRLLGYENRDVADKDFRNDRVDGGEVGAGHTVTALYELKLHEDAPKGRLATVYVRYKDVDRENSVREFSQDITAADFRDSFDAASPALRIAASSAEFAEILRRSYWARESDLGAVLDTVQAAEAPFKHDAKVIELASLVAKAHKLLEAENGPVVVPAEKEAFGK